MSTVWFVVDDTDPRLSYSGSWSFVSNTGTSGNPVDNDEDIDEMSMTGPAFNRTLHHTTGNGTISFRFNGSSYLGVYGTIDGTVAPTQLPSIRCSLDGADTTFFNPVFHAGFTNNNNIACRADPVKPGSSPGEHELIINVTNIDSDWFFDYITYESLANPVLDGEVLQAGNGETTNPSNYSMLTFGPGWGPTTSDSSTVTAIQGSEATVKFNGTSLSLYGNLNGSISGAATYTVDAQDPVSFSLPGSNSGLLQKQHLFTASNFAAGEHTVVVAFDGTAEGMPLDINYFLVNSLTEVQQAPPSPSSSSTPTGSAIPQQTDSSSRQSHAGLIVGVVSGAVIALAMGTAVIWWVRRSKRLKRQEILHATPFQSETMGRDVGLGSIIYEKHSSGPSSVTNPPSELADGDSRPPSPANMLTMKLQQRLIVIRDQIEHSRRQSSEGSIRQHQMLTVHTDSGLRGVEQEVLDPGLILEVPPGYTPE
ncbi:hypothetical protein BDP27DRAFT_1451032 [Rhodocollybia butyracea]|uniref:Uncharacterized protein n=1 Tax=Rhodocollybia butyracea TaxID=206335 RepID=A0A9P5PIF8_9AGAR|nr:hypothetical protein BDP27DRAFT_1451032 [Rhodocollybia butyracea]